MKKHLPELDLIMDTVLKYNPKNKDKSSLKIISDAEKLDDTPPSKKSSEECDEQ